MPGSSKSHTAALPALSGDTGAKTVVPGWTDIEPPTMTDRLLHAGTARATMGISPVSIALAYVDWALHLAESPGKWQRLAEKAIRK